MDTYQITLSRHRFESKVCFGFSFHLPLRTAVSTNKRNTALIPLVVQVIAVVDLRDHDETIVCAPQKMNCSIVE